MKFSEIHKDKIECIVPNLSPQAANAFGAFLQWADDNQLEPISAEKTVYGDCWAGTLDLECTLNGTHTVIDFKTSKAFYPEYRPQIAAYRSATPAKASGILRLDKETGIPEYKDFSKSYKKDIREFELALELYMHRHPRIAQKAGWEG